MCHDWDGAITYHGQGVSPNRIQKVGTAISPPEVPAASSILMSHSFLLFTTAPSLPWNQGPGRKAERRSGG